MSTTDHVNLAHYRIEKSERQLLIAREALKDGFFEEAVSKEMAEVELSHAEQFLDEAKQVLTRLIAG